MYRYHQPSEDESLAYQVLSQRLFSNQQIHKVNFFIFEKEAGNRKENFQNFSNFSEVLYRSSFEMSV